MWVGEEQLNRARAMVTQEGEPNINACDVEEGEA